MGQGLDVLQACNGPQEMKSVERDRASSDDISGNTGRGSPPGANGGDGGYGNDPVLLSREASRKKSQEAVKQAREWQQQIRSENRQLNRDIERIRREEQKLKKEIQTMANKGQTQNVQTLAKQLVKSRHAVSRLERTKCSMDALQLHLTTAIASASSAGALKMSADMMKEMNKVMNVPELQRTMQEMQVEMSKAEIADEMMEEGFNESDDELEVDSEVQKVYDELALDTSRLLAKSGAVPPAAVAATPTPMHAGPCGSNSGGGQDPLHQRLHALQA